MCTVVKDGVQMHLQQYLFISFKTHLFLNILCTYTTTKVTNGFQNCLFLSQKNIKNS